MFDKISFLIMRHLQFMNILVDVSEIALKHAENGNVDRVSLESSNKDKLINILIGFHDQINQLIREYKQTKPKDEALEAIFKTWAKESDEKITTIRILDSRILELLNKEQAKTKKEIGSVYQNRTKLNGYNLDNVK